MKNNYAFTDYYKYAANSVQFVDFFGSIIDVNGILIAGPVICPGSGFFALIKYNQGAFLIRRDLTERRAMRGSKKAVMTDRQIPVVTFTPVIKSI